MSEQTDQIGRLNRRLLVLELTVWGQRSLRLLVRSTWLGLGGYLLARSLSTYWALLADPAIWKWVGIAFALPALIGVILSRPTRLKLVWSIDRHLGLSEQVSTAWEVLKQKSAGQVALLLVSDVQAILPQVHKRILLHGWFLTRDLIALALVGVLALCTSFASSQTSFLPTQPGSIERLPPLGEDPRAAEIFPTGLSKLSPEQQNKEQGGQPGGGGKQPENQPNTGQGKQGNTPGSGDPQGIQEAVRQLGEQLSQQAATYELGQALQNMDLAKAASEMENLADQADSLSKETREQLSEAMQQAADQLEPSMDETQPPLPQDLRSAADELKPPEPSGTGGAGATPTPSASTPAGGEQPGNGESGEATASDKLDQLAQDMRQMDQQMQTGLSGGSSLSGPGDSALMSEPAARLEGGSDQDFKIQVTAQPSGWLSPSQAQQTGAGAASGAINASQTGSQTSVGGTIYPVYYPWNWLYAVAAYFQR